MYEETATSPAASDRKEAMMGDRMSVERVPLPMIAFQQPFKTDSGHVMIVTYSPDRTSLPCDNEDQWRRHLEFFSHISNCKDVTSLQTLLEEIAAMANPKANQVFQTLACRCSSSTLLL